MSASRNEREQSYRKERKRVSSPKRAKAAKAGRENVCRFPETSLSRVIGKGESESVPLKEREQRFREKSKRVSFPKRARAALSGKEQASQFPETGESSVIGKRANESVPQKEREQRYREKRKRVSSPKHPKTASLGT